ncbi:MAG: DUF2851 family protein [Calditrichaeota bacterium]|nr:MAG: DUF2851 family protein [Calditrichota bacterium]
MLRIPEHWLYHTYLDGHLLPPSLRTAEGRLLRILEPGTFNPREGPDFLHALIEVEGIRQRGDVEIHLTPEEWFRHGHQEDARYRNVLVHLVWEAPRGIPPALARRCHQVIVRSQLRLPEGEWLARMRRLDDRGGPAFAAPTPGRLTEAVVTRLAWRRFQRKRERLREWSRYFPPEEVLYLALAETLGYRHNRDILRQLLWDLTPSGVVEAFAPGQRSPLAYWVALAWSGGLLEPHRLGGFGGASPPALEGLLRWYEALSRRGWAPRFSLTDWHRGGVRPANHPALRLALLAELLYHHPPGVLFARLLEVARERLPLSRALPRWAACLRVPPERALREALRALYGWKRLPTDRLGHTRIRQFLINALLPLFSLWAERCGHWGFQQYIEGLYEAFPGAEDDSVTRRLQHLVSGDRLRRAVARRGFFQQGVLEALAGAPTGFAHQI